MTDDQEDTEGEPEEGHPGAVGAGAGAGDQEWASAARGMMARAMDTSALQRAAQSVLGSDSFRKMLDPTAQSLSSALGEALRAYEADFEAAKRAAALTSFHLSPDLARLAAGISATGVLDQALARSSPRKSSPRRPRTAADFFGRHALDATDVASFVKAASTIESKHHEHRLVWRGHQSAKFEVHSTLYRRFADPSSEQRQEPRRPAESDLMESEQEALGRAAERGLSFPTPLRGLADLQHFGIPTRLLDVTYDSSVAAWFATEESRTPVDREDALLIAWGRLPRASSRGFGSEAPPIVDLPFDLWWHTLNDEQRRQFGWGTGQAVWGWSPPALNGRMAAQRAGFLIDAAPTLTEAQLEVVSESLDEDWTLSEVANATSVVGVPTYAGRKTRANSLQMAPIFTIRIAAEAKPAIRAYLENRNLTHRALYPDMDGLRRELTGPYGINGRQLPARST